MRQLHTDRDNGGRQIAVVYNAVLSGRKNRVFWRPCEPSAATVYSVRTTNLENDVFVETIGR